MSVRGFLFKSLRRVLISSITHRVLTRSSAEAAMGTWQITALSIVLAILSVLPTVTGTNHILDIHTAYRVAKRGVEQQIDAELHFSANYTVSVGTIHSGFGVISTNLKGGDVTTKYMDFNGQLQTDYYRSLLKIYDARAPQVLELDRSDLRRENEDSIENSISLCPTDTKQCSDSDRYRTIDGSCNNVRTPSQGKSFTLLRRLLPSEYGDGVSSLRKARDGGELPNARLVSRILHEDTERPKDLSAFTVHTTFAGQFLDHDLSKVPVTKILKSDGIFRKQVIDVKCGHDNCTTGPGALRSCAPVSMPINDKHASDKVCLEFVRSSSAPREGCKFGPREQPNSITSYLDLSQVYGNSAEEAAKVRDENRRRGKMKSLNHPFNSKLKPLLPKRDDKTCRDLTGPISCFLAGDDRVNENVGLTCLHHLYAREHNRLEEGLHRLNPHWDGERLFQEARRINIAQWQTFVYKEFLPTIIGPKYMRDYRLFLSKDDYFTGYDDTSDASISNIFTTSAFRFGHSTIPATIKRSDMYHRTIDERDISTVFTRPELIYQWKEGGIDSLVMGTLDNSMEPVDPKITEEVTLHLFSENPKMKQLGMDLVVLNLQRGRDHGLPGYNAWRQLCGGNRANTFADFMYGPKEFRLKYETVLKLIQLYSHPDDVDSFSGGLLEEPLPAASVGPTFACIMAEQFQRLKRGDRFWFENKQAGFTPEQLRSIKRTSKSRIICDNLDSIRTIQPKALLRAFEDVITSPKFHYQNGYHLLELYENSDNKRVHCSQIPGTNLNLWKEKPPRRVQDSAPAPIQYIGPLNRAHAPSSTPIRYIGTSRQAHAPSSTPIRYIGPSRRAQAPGTTLIRSAGPLRRAQPPVTTPIRNKWQLRRAQAPVTTHIRNNGPSRRAQAPATSSIWYDGQRRRQSLNQNDFTRQKDFIDRNTPDGTYPF